VCTVTLHSAAQNSSVIFPPIRYHQTETLSIERRVANELVDAHMQAFRKGKL